MCFVIFVHMNLTEALKRYSEIVDTYDSISFDDKHAAGGLMKDLSVTLSYLTMERVSYQKKWNAVVFNHEGSNAAGEKKADKEVPELYQLRRIHEAGKAILDTMRSHVSLLKQES